MFKLTKSASFNANNITVSEYSGNFIEANSPGTITFTSSKFEDLDLDSSTPFINIDLLGSSSSFHSIKNISFQNVSVKNSLIMLNDETDGGSKVLLENITMTNIIKKIIINKSQEDLQYELKGIVGICIVSNRMTINITGSAFRNIDSHCIQVIMSESYFYYNTFDNSELIETSSISLTSTIDSSQGVTWIIRNCSVRSVFTTVFVFLSNRFIENKLLTKYGGVLKEKDS